MDLGAGRPANVFKLYVIDCLVAEETPYSFVCAALIDNERVGVNRYVLRHGGSDNPR